MFKKPLADLKTSAPLRSSDRRKLKQRVLQSFDHLAPEDGDPLVPEGLLSQKFSTHLNEPGVAYISPEGDPLWFTIGKGSDDLVPTVYTLWKQPALLPILSTPSAVIPKLVGGADLMIPGVVQYSSSLTPDQLVSITQFHRDKIGFPIAVGRMAMSSDALKQALEKDSKGKAVYVLQTWKDFLWDMGVSKKMDVPEARVIEVGEPPLGLDGSYSDSGEDEAQDEPSVGERKVVTRQLVADDHSSTEPSASLPEGDEPPAVETFSSLTAEEVSNCLREALLQALSTTLSAAPSSVFPISASAFWSSYVLPARAAHVLGSTTDAIDVKHSTYKSVKVFLKASAKEGLVKLKDAKGGDVVVAAVFPNHPAVAGHHLHRTAKDVETMVQNAEDRERRKKDAEEKRRAEIHVTEFWKPFGSTVAWFVAAQKDTSELYTLPDVKRIFDTYISSKNLVNAQEQQYVNVSEDAALHSAIVRKNEDTIEFMKRDEVFGRIKDSMQSWYEIRVGGADIIRKKGQLKPISVVMKVRQGRKACTLVTGFEPFSLVADDLANELRRICASSTSVSPVAGKISDMEVMVQGKQVKIVTDLLIAKGVPKKWIDSADLSAGKRKK
ncbi:eukaryotic translation initiation factor SUI1 family protein [Sparassis latifolia]|uniref:SUI1 domain-containing protein n=1 Tax=Sparassis crispa TaxID=139825 RepID=A0A401G9E1_9APHY|nr:hypothetical protein SCP_0116450 [Sparassis crispa]GBE78753.1 hypothetical protein SCP_0116450 [Sparassis crispa]